MGTKPLRYWFWYLPTTLDTHKADRAAVMAVAKNIYAPLVSTYMDGKAQGMAAESWQVDRTGKVWRFKIRKGLVFEDGAPITPEVVLLNLRRILWLTRGEGLLLNSLLPEVAGWKDYGKPLDSLFVDGDSVVFKFDRRPMNLFEEISMPVYGIADPKCFDDKGEWKDPMCASASGQYRIVEMDRDKIVLRSRQVFPAAGHAPEVVEIRAKADRNTAPLLSSGRGELTIQASFDVDDETLAQVRAKKLRMTEEPAARMHFMQLNHLRGPFRDKALRRSVRDAFHAGLAKDPAFAAETELSPSFIPKGGVGYLPFSFPAGQTAEAAARGTAVVLSAPLPKRLTRKGHKIQKALEDAVTEVLKAHGLKTRIVRCDGAELIEKQDKGEFDALFRFSGVSIDDPFAALRMMFMSEMGACIPDPSGDVPQLIEQAEATDDSGRRKAIAEKINKSIYEEAAVVTYAHSSLAYIHVPAVDLSHLNLFSDPIEFRAVEWRPGR